MTEESFGPVVGIQPVKDDEEAIRLMNDSRYGLTASIWTQDADAALRIGERVETGTWFMNRCDYLDPALAWTGVKDSGRGCTLSKLGLETFTRPIGVPRPFTCGWRRSWSRFVAPIQLAWERPVRCCGAGAEGVSPAKLSGKRTARGPGALERRPWRPRRRNTPQALRLRPISQANGQRGRETQPGQSCSLRRRHWICRRN